MSKIEWKQSYSVGIDEIDEQHKELIALINDLQEALDQSKGNEVISDIINKVVDYTHYHFDHEEKLLEKKSYPDLAEHKKVHAQYRADMQQLKEQFESSDMFFKPKLVRKLMMWLRTHIMETDMRYSQHFKANDQL